MKLLIIVLLMLIAARFSYADTTDFWHVYYNQKQIGDFAEYSDSNILTISCSAVHDNDSLHVSYFKDAPCDDCQMHLVFYQGKDRVFESPKVFGTFSLLSVPIAPLIRFKKERSSLTVFYAEDNRQLRYLFNLQLR